MLGEGDGLPKLTMLDDTGVSVSTGDLLEGKHLVLWFYPKDSTPG